MPFCENSFPLSRGFIVRVLKRPWLSIVFVLSLLSLASISQALKGLFRSPCVFLFVFYAVVRHLLKAVSVIITIKITGVRYKLAIACSGRLVCDITFLLLLLLLLLLCCYYC